MKKSLPGIIMLSCAILVIFFTSCAQHPKPAGNNQQKQDSVQNVTDTVIKNAMQKKEAYLKELKAMNTEKLVSQLTAESERGLEPFNSLAYAEAIARKKDDIDNYAGLIRNPTRTSLLALLALRQKDSIFYREFNQPLRVQVLTDALANAKLYNAFGLPHVKWEEAARAIISEGAAITDSLKSLLRNTKPAPVWGSEDYAEYAAYQYRVCDYALALLMAINKQSFTMPKNPEERNRMINELLGDKKG